MLFLELEYKHLKHQDGTILIQQKDHRFLSPGYKYPFSFANCDVDKLVHFEPQSHQRKNEIRSTSLGC